MVYGVGGWHQSFLSRLVLINGAPVGRSSRGHTNTHAPDDDDDYKYDYDDDDDVTVEDDNNETWHLEWKVQTRQPFREE